MKSVLAKAVTHREFLRMCGLTLAGAGAGQLVASPEPVYAETFSTLTVSGSSYLATTSGNVGIGTVNPAQLLDVKGANMAIRATMTGSTGANGKFQIYSSDITNNPFVEMQFYAPTGGGSEYLRFNVLNSSGSVYGDALTINRVGNVGIGTSSPQSALHIASGALRIGSRVVADSGGAYYA